MTTKSAQGIISRVVYKTNKKKTFTFTQLLVVAFLTLLGGLVLGHSLPQSAKVTPSNMPKKSAQNPNDSSFHWGNPAIPLDLKEMGIKLNSYIGLPELKYRYIKAADGSEAALLYTEALAIYCPDGGPLGILRKNAGLYNDYANPKPGLLLAQKESYFFTYSPPQQECTLDPKGAKLQADQQNLVERLILRSQSFF